MTVDWRQRGGQVNAGMQLAPMDLNKEHLFELVSVEVQEGVTTKFGLKNKVKMVWKEAGKDKDYHRVWTSFNESYAEKSNLVAFLKRVSPKPILFGVNITLGEYLQEGMQIKTMLQAMMDNQTGMPSGYYDFVPASIRPAATLPQSNGAVSVAVQQALQQYAVGAKTGGDVFGLLIGKVPNEVIQQFVADDKSGLIKYPIQ